MLLTRSFAEQSDIQFDQVAAGRANLDDYMGMRQQAMDDRFPHDPERLQRVHRSTEVWLAENLTGEGTDYATYDREAIERKMLGLADFMVANHPEDITQSEIDATRLFIDTAFTMWDESKEVPKGEQHYDSDGSFAFVVPMRVSRDWEEYGEEVEMISPVLRYVPNKYRAMFAVGLPPLVLDRYLPDAEDGSRGYLVLAPVYQDMLADLPKFEAAMTATTNINDTVNFAQARLGANVIGLGATLPRVTMFGQTIMNKDVVTTTGHGGTVHLIMETAREAAERGYVSGDAHKKIGVLGLGSIGASIAHLVADKYPESSVKVYDSRPEVVAELLAKLGPLGLGVEVADDTADLINSSEIVISAITTSINLTEHPEVQDLTGKIIIDDSQPGCFDNNQVEALGGRMTWVIGTDTSGRIVRSGYDYGTLADAESDTFGCEAEVATLAMYSKELKERGFSDKARNNLLRKVALREAVTPSKARIIGGLFRKYGITPAPFQVFGEHIQKP